MIIQIGTEVDESRILWKRKESDEWKRADIDDLIRAYENRPAGEWIVEHSGNGWNEWTNYICSECNEKFNKFYASNYCPNCGAKMKGGAE